MVKLTRKMMRAGWMVQATGRAMERVTPALGLMMGRAMEPVMELVMGRAMAQEVCSMVGQVMEREVSREMELAAARAMARATFSLSSNLRLEIPISDFKF